MNFGDNILVICTYQELADQYRKILEEKHLNIDIEVMDNRFGKDMQKIFEYMTQFQNKGKEIVITRGFFAQQIREHLPYKVIEIHIGAADMFRALYPLTGKGYTVGIVESEPYVKVAKQVAEILGISLKTYPVIEVEDFEQGLIQAKKDGVDVVVGGAWHSYDSAFFDDYNIPYVVVESSKESMESSLQNALEMYALSYERQKQNELLEKILSVSEDGVCVLDEKNHPILMNSFGQRLLNDAGQEQEFLSLMEKGKFEDGQQQHEISVEKLGEEYFLFQRIPLEVQGELVGNVVIFKREMKIRDDENLLRAELSKKGLHAKYTLQDIQGKSKVICELKKRVERYAVTDATVLILGESGTGKELFAQAIHNCSLRRNNPFVAINCSALPPNLLESELFGYVDGAFTGAKKGGKAGVFEIAHTGTIFLDEIGEMDLGMQTRLLRALQEREIMRIGDNKVISVDVRVIAATNRDLFREVEEGRFREDLYYRLNILDISIPPLRERKDDIAVIANGLLPQINERMHTHVTAIDEAVLQRLKTFTWHGNIRELRNTLEKMILNVQYGIIKMDRVDFILKDMEWKNVSKKSNETMEICTLAEMEEKMIRQALREEDGNQTKAAMRLGIDRSTLYRKISKML